MRVSFYLLTPDAKDKSKLYISLTRKDERLRFPSNEEFIAKYCNIRKKKGSKDLIKRNTEFYFDYTEKLNRIKSDLERIRLDAEREEKYLSLAEIKETYYLKIGKLQKEKELSTFQVFDKFTEGHRHQWSEGTLKKFNSIKSHIEKFEKLFQPILLTGINEELWNKIRDEYFVVVCEFSNPSINKNLEAFKQFIKWAIRKDYIKSFPLEDLKYLQEIEAFKIALKEAEVEKLATMDLSHRHEKVRDLFLLEIMTGQRFSDLAKVLDKKNFSGSNIIIYQQKTNEKAVIPIHPKLKVHLNKIFEKYPEGLPVISNQKFNEYLCEICKLAKFNREHSWLKLSGKNKIQVTDFRYNLITSHTGRRTFATLALKRGIDPELIMKVTGHRSYDQFREYIKVDDEDMEEAFSKL
jgi:integrase